MATKTLRVFAEYTSTGFVPMPTAGNIDYGYTLGSTFPATTPTTFQTDNPDLVVTVTAMTDFYVWIRINGTAWNPSYTRNVRVYPDSPNINNVVMNMIIATGPSGIGAYTQIVQTSNRLYFNGATTDAVYNSKFAGKTYINELNFGTAPGLATVATTGAYADLTGKPSLATVATSGLFTDLSSKPSGTAPLSYNSGTNSFVITQANTSTNGYLSSTDWNTFNNKYLLPAGGTIDQYVNGSGTLTTFPTTLDSKRLIMSVRNETGATLIKGTVVYIVGIGGNTPLVSKAIASSDSTSAQTLGVLDADINNNQSGTAVLVGQVTALNTSSFTEGVQLYLSGTTAGTYTSTKSLAPTHLVYVGIVTRSHANQGVIEVKIQNGYELDEIHDVQISSPADKDILYRDSATSLWKHASISTVLGYTPYNGTNTSIKALFSASAPLSYSDGVYSISQATTSSNGYLSSADWNTFNGKENVLSFTTPLVRTTNTISINQASASTSGFLSSTDWNTFNNKGSGTGTVTSVAMTVPTGLSISGTPITTSGTLALSLTAGYVIPTTSSASNWDIAYTNRITSLTLNGSSGTATLAANVLNIPSYTLVGLGGQPALSGTGFVKISGTTISYDNSTYLTTASASSTYQTILTNPITGTGTINELAYFNTSSTVASLGVATYPSLTELAYVKGVTSAIQTQLNAKASTLSGTTNYIPKFTSSSAIGNSNIQDSGTALTFGVASTFSGNITVDKSSPNISLNAPSGTGGQYNLNNGAGTLMWAMYSVTGGSNTQGNWALYSAGKTGGAGNVMEVTPTGNFGINTSTPSQKLHISDSTSVYCRVVNTTGADVYLGAESMGVLSVSNNNALDIRTNNISRVYITAAGLVGIGTSSASNLLHVNGSGTETATFQTSGTASGIRLKNTGGTASEWIMQSEGGNSSAAFKIYSLTASAYRFTILGDGKIGINTTTPSQRLEVVDTLDTWIRVRNTTGGGYAAGFRLKAGSDNEYAFFGSDNNCGIRDMTSSATRLQVFSNGNIAIGTTSDNGYKLYVSGTIYATSNITANSDLTLKKNLKLIDNPIDKLMQLNGYAYQWKANDEHQYGVIAQEVEKILPYAVSTGLDGIKGVSYNQLTPLLIEGFKSHESEITILKARVKYLESKLA